VFNGAYNNKTIKKLIANLIPEWKRYLCWNSDKELRQMWRRKTWVMVVLHLWG